MVNGTNTGDLYTGKTSRSTKQRQDIRKEALEKRSQLLPYAQIIEEMIEKDKAEIMNIRNVPVEGKTENELSIELQVRKRMYDYMTNFKNRLTNIVSTREREAQNESK